MPDPLNPDASTRPAYPRRHRRRSMTYVTVAWMFGAVWLASTSGAPLTLFAEKLGASEFQFGLLAALPFLASLLSLPASVYTERSGQRKRVFFLGLYGQRLLWLPIAVMPVWIAWTWGIPSGWAAAVFLWLVFFMHAGQAVGGPAWVAWMAEVVPGRSRGTYFSRRRQWGILTAIPASLFVGWLLDQHRDGTDLAVLGWCSLIFICAMLFGVVDIVLFHFVPHVPRPKPAVPLRKMLVRPLHDRQFLRFGAFVGVLVFAVSFMGQFVTLYLIQKLHVSNTGIQLMLIAAPMLAQLLVLPMWGRVVDRMGKKPALAIASLGLVPVGLGWCFMNSGAVWLGYLLSVAGGALWVGVEVANLDLIMEFSEDRD
ncbi:MAG TPA: MFS transporter, partial [Tepidisphaeraceae bacterium]|nr:MFS transporter [Tepidisphaeraceae bacterium]